MKRTIATLAAVGLIALAGSSALAYDGRGSDNLPCTDYGYWVINHLDGADAPKLIVDDETALLVKQPNDKTAHYLSGPVTADSVVVVVPDIGKLQLSHCVDGSDEEPTPTPVVPTPTPVSEPTPTPTPTPTPQGGTQPTPTPTPQGGTQPTPTPFAGPTCAPDDADCNVATPTPKPTAKPTAPPTDTAPVSGGGSGPNGLPLVLLALAGLAGAALVLTPKRR